MPGKWVRECRGSREERSWCKKVVWEWKLWAFKSLDLLPWMSETLEKGLGSFSNPALVHVSKEIVSILKGGKKGAFEGRGCQNGSKWMCPPGDRKGEVKLHT